MEPSEVFDWAARFSEATHRRARLADLRREIATIRCGDCDKWMKSSECPREKHDMRKGRSYGPTCVAPICAVFVESASSARLRADRRAEFQRLESAHSGDVK